MNNVRKFNLQMVENRRLSGNAPTIIVVGRRGSGKSTLVEDILYHIREIRLIIIISETEEANNFYSKIVHPLWIHYEYDVNILNKLVSKQKEIVKFCRKNKLNPRDPKYCIGILLDDCGFDRSRFMNKIFKEIFMNGRQYNILCIIALQYITCIPPDIRYNIDYLFCLKVLEIENKKKIYDFFGIFDSKKDFFHVLESCTNNNECLVLDNTNGSSDIRDHVFFYKAKLGRKFHIPNKYSEWKKLDEKCKKKSITDSEKEEEGENNSPDIKVIRK